MRPVVGAFLACLVVASCSGTQPLVSPEEGERIARQCQDETNAVGTYSLRPAQVSASLDSRIPRASAVEGLGGTQAGEDAINACIQSKILGANQRVETVQSGNTRVVTYTYGTPPSQTRSDAPMRIVAGARQRLEAEMRAVGPAPRTAGCPDNAPAIYGGELYCIGR